MRSRHPHLGNDLHCRVGQPDNRQPLGRHRRAPDIEVTASHARDTAYQLALQAVIAARTASAAEASSALAST
jgi:hypothetical protein